jgi:plasmid stabilization system protein ParE
LPDIRGGRGGRCGHDDSSTVVGIAATPEIGRLLAERPQVRVVPLVRYPFKIFYTFDEETIAILHIRHAARRPWRGE